MNRAPNTLRYYPHQLEAIAFAKERSASYLALSPGLGKTIVAATLSREKGALTVYITPPSLIENVKAEYARFHPLARAAVYGDRKADFKTADLVLLPDSQLTAATFYFVMGILAKNEKRESLLIVDEAHRFTNEKAQRTMVLLGKKRGEGLISLFDSHVYMSGTPLSNRPMELYPILSRSAPETIGHMSYYDFGQRYCDGKKVQIKFGRSPKWAWDFSGQSNLKELSGKILGTFMLRQKKDRLELPPRIEEVFLFSRTMSPRLTGLDRRLGDEYEDVTDLMRRELAGSGDVHVATYRRLLGVEKARAAAEYIDAIMAETDESLIVFAEHKDAIASLSEFLHKHAPIIITGETPAGERQRLVDLFQSGKSRIVLGNYKAMGVGFTLTKASRVIFVEFSWNPADNEQAIDRAHRIGQTKTVYAQYMVYKDSIDKRVIEAILKKRQASVYF